MVPTVNSVICGDALEVMRQWPEHFVHCCVTSPPYWGLRKYGVDGEWGSERTLQEYVDHLVTLGRELRRVLRTDATWWLNLGDCYTPQSTHPGHRQTGMNQLSRMVKSESPLPSWGKPGDLCGVPWRVVLALQADGWWLRSDNIWTKDAPMPESVNGTRWEKHRLKVAIAAEPVGSTQHDHDPQSHRVATDKPQHRAEWTDCPGCPKCSPNGGLILRRGSWRPTRSHEYLFQLTPSADYYADREAVAEEVLESSVRRAEMPWHGTIDDGSNGARGGTSFRKAAEEGAPLGMMSPSGKRNPRSVLRFKFAPSKLPHFAAFPPSLPDWCLRASTSARGCCPKCGAQWARIIGRIKHPTSDMEARRAAAAARTGRMDGLCGPGGPPDTVETLGWRPICECNAGDPVPALVLDPFMGSGSTAVAATLLGRRWIGIDLKRAYVRMTEERVRDECGLLGTEGLRWK